GLWLIVTPPTGRARCIPRSKSCSLGVSTRPNAERWLPKCYWKSEGKVRENGKTAKGVCPSLFVLERKCVGGKEFPREFAKPTLSMRRPSPKEISAIETLETVRSFEKLYAS
uniref:Uncharacterized protein n=1 Tax=Parascaris univalens TaxID=6257 RepID=A0A915B792_PARUN